MKGMKKTVAILPGLVVLLMLVSGCAMTPGGVAPSNIPLEGRRFTRLGRAAETDSRIYLLGILPLSSANTTRDAMDAAIRSKRGDAMINITVESYSQWWIILTRIVTRVDGEVIRFE